MTRYSTLLLDLDHTLLDSATSEELAFRSAMSMAGISDPDRYFSVYDRINRRLWAAVERHKIGPDDVRVARFEGLVAEVGLDVDPVRLADDYVSGLGAFGDLYPGTREVLEELAGRGHAGDGHQRDRSGAALSNQQAGTGRLLRCDRHIG